MLDFYCTSYSTEMVHPVPMQASLGPRTLSGFAANTSKVLVEREDTSPAARALHNDRFVTSYQDSYHERAIPNVSRDLPANISQSSHSGYERNGDGFREPKQVAVDTSSARSMVCRTSASDFILVVRSGELLGRGGVVHFCGLRGSHLRHCVVVSVRSSLQTRARSRPSSYVVGARTLGGQAKNVRPYYNEREPANSTRFVTNYMGAYRPRSTQAPEGMVSCIPASQYTRSMSLRAPYGNGARAQSVSQARAAPRAIAVGDKFPGVYGGAKSNIINPTEERCFETEYSVRRQAAFFYGYRLRVSFIVCGSWSRLRCNAHRFLSQRTHPASAYQPHPGALPANVKITQSGFTRHL